MTVKIAIDGPSGAGKSTQARALASDMGFMYVDTGAIYRCVGLFALKNDVPTRDKEAVAGLLKDVVVTMSHDDNGLQIMSLNGENVTQEIRAPEISIAASDVSAIPEVRDFLLNMQRDLAKRYNIIMDGRDIGAVILPDADLKIFLTAAPEDRASRRYEELRLRGIEVSYDQVFSDLVTRDNNDSTREIAPLKPTGESVVIDTTGLTAEEGFGVLRRTIRERLGI